MNKKIICCWGDSITAGAWMKADECYPAYLSEELGDDFLVFNGGCCGERSETIMARQGAHKVFLKNKLFFEKGIATLQIGDISDNGLKTEKDETLMLTSYLGNQLSVNPLVINGELFDLSYLNWNRNPMAGDLMLTRRWIDEKLELKAGTEVIFDSVKFRKYTSCNIFFMGTNRGNTYTDADGLFKEQIFFVDNMDSPNFILVTPPFFPHDDTKYKNTFGNDRVFSLREYLTNEDVFFHADITPSDEDKKYIREGKIPPCFTFTPGDCHLSAHGYRMMAKGIAEKVKKYVVNHGSVK